MDGKGYEYTFLEEIKSYSPCEVNSTGWAFLFLFLMRFIDPRILDSNDIHRPHPGPQENLQIGGVRCAISQIWPKFREMLGENPADIHL